MTLAPTDIPTKRLIMMLITIPLLPTAASAWWLAYFPTTATSTELNDCCNTPLAMSGSANTIILRSMPPFSISI